MAGFSECGGVPEPTEVDGVGRLVACETGRGRLRRHRPASAGWVLSKVSSRIWTLLCMLSCVTVLGPFCRGAQSIGCNDSLQRMVAQLQTCMRSLCAAMTKQSAHATPK